MQFVIHFASESQFHNALILNRTYQVPYQNSHVGSPVALSFSLAGAVLSLSLSGKGGARLSSSVAVDGADEFGALPHPVLRFSDAHIPHDDR